MVLLVRENLNFRHMPENLHWCKQLHTLLISTLSWTAVRSVTSDSHHGDLWPYNQWVFYNFQTYEELSEWLESKTIVLRDAYIII